MTRTADEACQCWDGPATLHAGHCCVHDAPEHVVTFEALPCGHGDDARRRDTAARAARRKENSQ